jgi:excisionase family DNA binding protein
MSKFFTTGDAARFLGVTASRVRQLILAERLAAEKYGRDLLIEETALRKFVVSGKQKRGRPRKDEEKTLRKR